MKNFILWDQNVILEGSYETKPYSKLNVINFLTSLSHRVTPINQKRIVRTITQSHDYGKHDKLLLKNIKLEIFV